MSKHTQIQANESRKKIVHRRAQTWVKHYLRVSATAERKGNGKNLLICYKEKIRVADLFVWVFTILFHILYASSTIVSGENLSRHIIMTGRIDSEWWQEIYIFSLILAFYPSKVISSDLLQKLRQYLRHGNHSAFQADQFSPHHLLLLDTVVSIPAIVRSNFHE